MSDLELSLKAVLESHPDDWSTRFLLADKMLQRGAADEAAEAVAASPVAPGSEEDLQKAAEIAGVGAIPFAEAFIAHDPLSAYSHELLATLLEHRGETDRAARHFAVAAKLSGSVPDESTQVPGGPEVSSEFSQPPSNSFSTPPPPPPPPAISEVPAPDFDSDYSEEIVITENSEPPPAAGKKATAILLAVAVHAVIALIAMLVVIMPASRDEPEIVAAVIGPTVKKQEMQKKNVVKQTKKTTASSAAAAPMAQLMRANAVAKLSLPNVTKTSKGPLGLGDADFGSGGFGSGGGGLGSGASFFGGSSTGKRFLFVLDHSGSMKANQVKLRNTELEKALKSLKGVEYQVLLFAGGAYYGSKGWSLKQEKGRTNVAVGPKGTYKFVSKKGAGDYDFVGTDANLPKAEWLVSSPSNVKLTMDIIKRDKLFFGTDWGLALDVAHHMDPAPDVIFFMADGTGGNSPAPILATNRKKGRPVINTVAMQTTQGMKEFAEVARETKGSYTIVDKKGEPIDGFDYLKNPGKYKGRL
tara:strand:- start:21 stop:1601 length:1581 start_codon:yes stop_codon:yes gene_type:complete